MQYDSTANFRVSTPKFARVPSWAFALDISPRAFSLLCVILLDMFPNGAIRNDERFASLTRVAHRTYFRLLGELRECGAIVERDGHFHVQQPSFVLKPTSVPYLALVSANSDTEKCQEWHSYLNTIQLSDNRQENEVGKIVSQITRSGESSAQATRAIKEKTKKEQHVYDLADWFSRKFGLRRIDTGNAAHIRWMKLLNHYGSANAVQAACERAFDDKSLLTPKFPKFTLSTVCFYMDYKDVAPNGDEEKSNGIEQFKRCAEANNVDYARILAGMYGLSERDVRDGVAADFLRQVFTQAVDAVGHG